MDYRAGVRVTAVGPDGRQLSVNSEQLSVNGQLAYDKLVIATGSRLYAPLAGADSPGVYNFKSLRAAEELVARVRSGGAKTAVIVGAGFIGMEIALLLRDLGVQVTQVEMLDQVMNRMLDGDTAVIALERMRQRGVDVRLNTKAEAFVGNGRAAGVKLANGDRLEADILIAATGVKPNLDFLAGSGLAHNWGLTVDDHLRASQPDIYAGGDVIETTDRLTGETSVHAIFPNAVEQGRVVGLNLAGFDVAYGGADRMNSLKHLGLSIMAYGLKEGDEKLQARRDGALRTLYLRENRLVGFQLVRDTKAAGVLRALAVKGVDVRPLKDHLLDPAFGQGMVVGRAMVV